MQLAEWVRKYPWTRTTVRYSGVRGRYYTEIRGPRTRTMGEGSTFEESIINAQEGFTSAMRVSGILLSINNVGDNK